MISIRIQKQKEELKSKLKIELLSKTQKNKEKVKSFIANKYGKNLEKYLHENAWEEDNSGVTKVYLVKDEETDAILFFFALKAGLLYKEIGVDEYELTQQEKEIVDACIEFRLNPDSEIEPEEVLSWYDCDDIIVSKEKLLKIIDDVLNVKLEAKKDREQNNGSINDKQVLKTFPGIVITHFCKNVETDLYNNLDFPLGFYVFWEIIVDKVMEISSMLGCQYLYLFAADNTEHMQTSSIEDIVYDIDDETEIDDRRLVNYYKTEFKFEEPVHISILKPYYDYKCFSLVQPINELLKNRNISWIQHSDMEDV